MARVQRRTGATSTKVTYLYKHYGKLLEKETGTTTAGRSAVTREEGSELTAASADSKGALHDRTTARGEEDS